MNTTDFAPIPPVLYGHEVDREYGFDLAAAHEAALAWVRETPGAVMFWPTTRPIPEGCEVLRSFARKPLPEDAR